MRQTLRDHEREQIKILKQAGKNANSLKSKFRSDIIYSSYQIFDNLGLSLDILFDIQDKYPVIYPWNTEYDIYRNNVNRRISAFPLIIVMAQNEKDVQDMFKFALKYKIKVTLRGGAHSFEGFSLGSGMLIDQSLRTKVCINDIDHLAKIEPGCLLGPTASKLSKYGYALPAGTSPNVGVVGLALGGGIGFLSRRFGLTSDNIVEFDILLADGNIITANKYRYSDLYWAHRGGGGGNFGIILNMTLNVVKLPKVWAFSFLYNFEDFKIILKEWEGWAYNLNENFGSEFHCYNGGQLVSVSGEYFGDNEQEFRNGISIFYNLKPVTIDVEHVNYIDAVKKWGGCGHWRPFFKAKNAFIGEPFSDQALDLIQDYVSKGSGNDIFELTVMGGKVDHLKVDDTAFPHRNVKSWLLINTHWSDPSEADSEMKWISDFYNDLKPHLLDQVYVNGPDLDLPNPLQKYYQSNLNKLIQIKTKYDPSNIFNFQQSIPIKI